MLIKHGLQILFVLTNAFCTIIFFFYPETRGKSLEEIADIFGDVKTVHREDLGFEKPGLEIVETLPSDGKTKGN
jgi:hypothetical protein